MVPAFTGLGAPHWDPYARGMLVGLTRGVNRYHIVRAALDSLTYQTYDVLKAMRADSGIELSVLKADGGASANNYLMQTQADVMDAPVLRPRCVETTALGAAFLAGLAVGYWNNQEEVRKCWTPDRIFHREIEDERRKGMLRGWERAVRCCKCWSESQQQ